MSTQTESEFLYSSVHPRNPAQPPRAASSHRYLEAHAVSVSKLGASSDLTSLRPTRGEKGSGASAPWLPHPLHPLYARSGFLPVGGERRG